eukprot:TRINITY_DN3765_c1_g2_i2.p1 TRINITY_DN3765_c1_g2~~TRINITY_DN3765_c1_g2_i2.p1  ORF type:complete len:226 (+),score=2.27 TRINITY_DN3765_c1_g2_i2:44-679(+)
MQQQEKKKKEEEKPQPQQMQKKKKKEKKRELLIFCRLFVPVIVFVLRFFCFFLECLLFNLFSFSLVAPVSPAFVCGVIAPLCVVLWRCFFCFLFRFFVFVSHSVALLFCLFFVPRVCSVFLLFFFCFFPRCSLFLPWLLVQNEALSLFSLSLFSVNKQTKRTYTHTNLTTIQKPKKEKKKKRKRKGKRIAAFLCKKDKRKRGKRKKNTVEE